MRRNVRVTLDQIEDILLRNDQDAIDLWNILTALRGADHRSDDLHGRPLSKLSTTAPIRAAVFPRLAEFARRPTSDVHINAIFGLEGDKPSQESVEGDAPEIPFVTGDDHFLWHTVAAWKAINAREEETNERK